MTIKEGYDIFLQTNERYRSWLNVFLNFIQAYGHDPAAIDLDQISLKDLYLYLTWLRTRGYSLGSIRTYQISLKCMFSYLQQRGHMHSDRLDLNCYNLVQWMPPDRVELSAGEIERVDECLRLSSTRDLRDWCIFHLMLELDFTSLQISNLLTDHVDLDNGLVRSRPVSPMLQHNLILYDMRVDGSRRCNCFLVNRCGNPLSYDVIKKIFQRLQDLSGVSRLTPTLVKESCGVFRAG